MKLFNLLLLVLTLLTAGKTHAQSTELFALQSFPLEITFNKTVNLIFPYSIKSVDKGSRAILAQRAKGTDNILQLKAAQKEFEQTNLTVITSDGKLYCFNTSYSEEPLQLSIELIENGPTGQALLTAETSAAYLKNTALFINGQKHHRNRPNKTKNKIKLALHGVYTDQKILFLALQIQNQSSLSFDVESLRFFITDKKRPKRTAHQQIEIFPFNKTAVATRVDAADQQAFVCAFPKFSIPDAKKLTVQLLEKNGARNLELAIENKSIMKVKALP